MPNLFSVGASADASLRHQGEQLGGKERFGPNALFYRRHADPQHIK